MTNIVKETADAVARQGYEGAYIPQLIPGLGAAISIPTAFVSGISAIIKVAQAIFQYFNEGKPFFRPTDGNIENDENMSHVKFPMEDAKDLGLIFANNVANIFTFGILNCVIVLKVLNEIVINKAEI